MGPEDGANITVTVTNLIAGVYDFYLYGHGDADYEDSVFQLTVGSQSYGAEATTNGSGWLSPLWQEGVQHVEFTNVSVPAGQTITITVEPGAGDQSEISGLQMASVGPSPASPFFVNQPASQAVAMDATACFSVVASGAPPLAYQWLLDNSTISAATNSSYGVAAK